MIPDISLVPNLITSLVELLKKLLMNFYVPYKLDLKGVT